MACLEYKGDTQQCHLSPKAVLVSCALLRLLKPLARSHYLGFPQLFGGESFSGLSATASGTDTLPVCSSGFLGISLRHGPFSWTILAAPATSTNHSVGRSERSVGSVGPYVLLWLTWKVSRLFKSWVQISGLALWCLRQISYSLLQIIYRLPKSTSHHRGRDEDEVTPDLLR